MTVRPLGDVTALEPAPPERLSELVAASFAQLVATFVANDPIETEKSDAATLHDARVALRKLRSHLRTYRQFFAPGWAKDARDDLAWFSGLLGDVRQMDIVAERVGTYPEAGNEDARRVLRQVDADRKFFLDRLAAEGRSARYGDVRARLEEIRERAPFRSPAKKSALIALGPTLKGPWKEAQRAARRALATKDEVSLHTLRIRAKELRYAAELAAPLLGPATKRLGKAASRVQDRIGDHRDAEFTASYLDELAHNDPRSTSLATELAARERRAAKGLLVEVREDLRRLRRSWDEAEETLRKKPSKKPRSD